MKELILRSLGAVAYRDARHAVVVVGMWDGPEDDERNRHWVRKVWGAVEPFSSGGYYVNYDADADADADPDRIRAAHGPAKYDRLASVKATVDPQNLFRLNQNIRPASASRSDR